MAPVGIMNRSSFSIAVYCGSRHGEDPAYTQAARQLGAAIGAHGWRLVYGGGKVGLMGEVADATLAAGGQVVGVIPETLMQREVGHAHLHELHVVPNMHVRKQMMADRADAFIALPGGIGTLEELFEVWTWRQLGYHARPIGLLNVAGYYDPLLDFMRRTVEQGFLSADQLDVLLVGQDPTELLERLATAAPAGHSEADLGKI
jgi:uncharacterized protein (TIGR00730 family)